MEKILLLIHNNPLPEKLSDLLHEVAKTKRITFDVICLKTEKNPIDIYKIIVNNDDYSGMFSVYEINTKDAGVIWGREFVSLWKFMNIYIGGSKDE